MLSKRQKSITLYKYLMSQINWIAHHFLYVTLWLITKVISILSSISSRLECWSVTSICENSELKVLKKFKFLGELYNNWQNDLIETSVYKTSEFCW